MRFFTPELYLEFNSQDDAVADQANEAWEGALTAYREHLAAIHNCLPHQVRKLSELCLHDAELLGSELRTEAVNATPTSPCPEVAGNSIAVLSLNQNETITSLIYSLARDTDAFPPPESWPFSGSRKHWLYDEIDLVGDQPDAFVHRILWSDGSVLRVSFFSVIIHSFPFPESGQENPSRQIA